MWLALEYIKITHFIVICSVVSLIYIRTLPKMRFNLLPSRQESVYADDFMFKLITAIPKKRQGDKEVALARRLP